MNFNQAQAEAKRLRKRGVECRIEGHEVHTERGSYVCYTVTKIRRWEGQFWTYPVFNAQGREVWVSIPSD